MIERLLETWLTKANERSFQIPFAHSLASDGHAVLHVSRHCGMEIGKDIISIAPDGVPCAYQIKGVNGKRLTQSKWRSEVSAQIHALLNSKIVHPSLSTSTPHRSYLVLNGQVEEEVQREIDDMNRMYRDDGLASRQLNLIVYGELFKRFKDLQSDFWATNLSDLKRYLDLFLQSGKGTLKKAQLAKLIESSLPIRSAITNRPAGTEIQRALSGCAIICSAALSSYTVNENHSAEFEAWTLFHGYALAVAEKWGLDELQVEFARKIALESIYTSLARLCDELQTRRNLVQGDLMLDRAVYQVRLTHLMGLMGLFGLLIIERKNNGEQVEMSQYDYVVRFCDEHQHKLYLWGEAAIPQILAWNFFRRTYDATLKTDGVYSELVERISRLNQPGSSNCLPNAYYDAESVMPRALGLSKQPLRDNFAGRSNYLESVLHLLVRAGLKQRVKLLLPDATRIAFSSYSPKRSWHFYRYRNWNLGTDVERFLVPPHRWKDLRQLAAESDGVEVPSLLRKYPLLYLATLLVMPYRGTASGVRWLASYVDEMAINKSVAT